MIACPPQTLSLIRTGLRRPLGDFLLWHVHPEFRVAFEPWIRKHWPRILHEPGARLKSDPSGCVVQSDGFVLKEYRKRRGLCAFGHPSAARRAFHVALRIQQAGIPIPPPVAWCVQRRFGFLIREYLVTQTVDAKPLIAWLAETDRNPHLIADLLFQWGRLLGQFHGIGFSHRDLKDDNLLATSSPIGPRLVAVDLDSVFRCPFRRRARFRRDFWPLLRSLLFLRLFEPTSVRTLLAGYNQVADSLFTEADLPRVVESMSVPHRSGGRVRVLIAMSGFQREYLDIRAEGMRDVPIADLFLYWVNRLETLRPIRHSPRVHVVAGVWRDLDVVCHFKRYPRPPMGRLLAQWLGAPSAAARAARGLARLADRGLRVPVVRAVLEGRRGLRPCASALVCETVQAPSLNAWLAQPHSRHQRQGVLACLARELGEIHRTGLFLPRLKLSDILVRAEPSRLGYALVWTDADDLTTPASARRVLSQLAQGIATAADIISAPEMRYFWRCYTQARGWPPSHASRHLRRLLYLWRVLRNGQPPSNQPTGCI